VRSQSKRCSARPGSRRPLPHPADPLVGEAADRDDSIAAVTLTGSVEAGRQVAAQAGAALKKTVLELGGSDAYLVLEDADIEAAARSRPPPAWSTAARAASPASASSWSARSAKASNARWSSDGRLHPRRPAGWATKLPPMVDVKSRDGVHRQVRESMENGARLLLGGEVPDRAGPGTPTVLTDVRPASRPRREVLGPVAAIIEAADEADAIRIANASEFGLGSGVLTPRLARGERIAAEELEAGMSFVNQNVRSDPRLPFGGEALRLRPRGLPQRHPRVRQREDRCWCTRSEPCSLVCPRRKP
jgi:succinate-semialdehyde dehydrogenase/glutarate-semialdehyde dehydrogenase